MSALIILIIILTFVCLILSMVESIFYTRLVHAGIVSRTRKISLSFLDMQLEKSMPEEDRHKIEFLKQFHIVLLFFFYGWLLLAVFQIGLLIA